MAAICRAAVLALPAVAASAGNAGAALDDWRLGDGDDGLVIASLFATNKLSTGGGALSYSPTLTIGCRSSGEPRWMEWLQLNEAVSAKKTITMSVTVDGGKPADESWTVGHRGRVLVLEGEAGIKRLAAADDLRLSWRFGLLAGRGEALFDLDGIQQAIGKIAAACKTDAP